MLFVIPEEAEPENPIDEELLKGWEIVKGSIKELKITE
ncbi:unnamed protein product, partial [marine sediment metagenome]